LTAEKARTTWNLRSPITRASDTLSPWPSATGSVRDARLAAADDADADTDDAAEVSPAGAVVDVVVVVVAGSSLSAPPLPLLEPALGLLSASGGGFCGVRLRKLSLLKSVSPMVSGDPDVGDDDSEPDGDVDDDDPLVRNVMAADDSVDDNRSAAALSEPSPPPPPLELALVGAETFLGAVGSAGGGCGVAASPLDLRSSFLRSMSPRCCCCCSWARLTFSDICCSRWSVDRLLRAARP
jgi:hypothetical protein